ncbi:hypothetical protein CFN78_25580 [Amycolatopsis antarctica]|uniref:Uncharacterized protein n=1 Tax=Amycolatopsis antarctica TaxID=1854586 RepID=A0A263CW01_9PSEU|nr:hypothetical protein [Amycolatopsis antarctica]OZM70303.1 hypothetical protein CFN78_25580 [Amycolatopsis antarctica]
MSGGFHHDEGALTKAAQDLRVGVGYLDLLADNLPDAVDAGFSSEVVGAALVRISQGSAALAQIGEEIAAKVDAADGSYADIENSNEGRLRLDSANSEAAVKTIDQVNREQQQQAQANPFEDAPAPAPSEQPPEPKAATPGRTPEPPAPG